MDLNINIADDAKLCKIQKGIDLILNQGKLHEQLLEQIMSIVSDHVAAMEPQIQRIEANTNALVAEVNRLREQLASSSSSSPSDQEALNVQLARTTAVAEMVPPVA